MNKITKYIIGSVIILILVAISYSYGTKVGQSPNVIFLAASDDVNHMQWKKDPNLANDSIVSVTVVTKTDKQLTVYVDYIYSGSHGNSATTCGSVLKDGSGRFWSCFPTGIGKGRGFVTLKFNLTDRAKGIICSDAIRINYYDKNGNTFFKKIVPFRKKWVQDGLNVIGKINASMPGCPSEDGTGKDNNVNTDTVNQTGDKKAKVNAHFNVLENLLSTEESVRSGAYDALFNELSGVSPRLYMRNHKKLLDTLAIALNSDDLRTSHYAIAIIYQLSQGTLVVRQGIPTTVKYPDIRISGNLKSALVKAIKNSSNKDVNRLSAASLVQGYDFTPDMEAFLVSQFQRNEHSPIIKEGILTALSLMADPSFNPSGYFHEDTIAVIIKAINNPDIEISRTAIGIIVGTKTKAALPVLIDKLKETDNLYITKGVLVALERQKDNANSYIPDLEVIVKGLPDGQYKTDLSETIEHLRH
jgi:hypothetical protein